jgi:hypothetical protein
MSRKEDRSKIENCGVYKQSRRKIHLSFSFRFLEGVTSENFKHDPSKGYSGSGRPLYAEDDNL